MAIFHNLHCYLSGTSHHHLSPGLLQELSDLPVHLYTQQSMCHTTAKFFFLILSRIMSFFSKYSKVFHLILSKKQNSYNGLYNPQQILSQTYALHSLSCFYSTPGTCHMCSRFMAFAFLPALSKLLSHVYSLTSFRFLLQSDFLSEIFSDCSIQCYNILNSLFYFFFHHLPYCMFCLLFFVSFYKNRNSTNAGFLFGSLHY